MSTFAKVTLGTIGAAVTFVVGAVWGTKVGLEHGIEIGRHTKELEDFFASDEAEATE